MFKKTKYKVLKGAISKELAAFVYSYFLKRREVASFLLEHKYMSPFTEYWGVWTDTQAPNTYSHYADVAMETLLEALREKMEKETGGHGGHIAWKQYSYWHFMKHEFDHAGFVETSIMLAISDKVKMKKAKKGFTTEGLSEKEIQRINKLSTQPGGFPKVAKNGVWGDPTGATKKDGEKFLAEIVRNLAKECQS